VLEFVRRLTFSILIGNADMHLKNWSLLYTQPQKPELSPAYDFVSTIGYIPDFQLGLSLSREKNMYKIDESHFRRMAVKASLPEALVVRGMKETIENFHLLWPRAKQELPMSKRLIQEIEKHRSKILL
ncbi:MAG: HipA domain-containing protein, partial [Candidatus Obscuribacterales bacterium]|nr:HipA domain-containing protein [Candidatus Obscuribacterales bacterium]